eukprot:2249236-Rhodomonas_salina.1
MVESGGKVFVLGGFTYDGERLCVRQSRATLFRPHARRRPRTGHALPKLQQQVPAAAARAGLRCHAKQSTCALLRQGQ